MLKNGSDTNCVETKKALLGKDEKLTVDQALDCARRKESTRNDLRDLDMYDKPGQGNMEGATRIDAAYYEGKRKAKSPRTKLKLRSLRENLWHFV